MANSHDLVVVGGGPAGYAAALYAAGAGLSVALIEEDRVGGTCLHRGCVPAKQLLETAAVMRQVSGAKSFGIEAGQPQLDMSISQARKAKVVEKLFRGLAGLISRRGIDLIRASGRLVSPGQVELRPSGDAPESAGRTGEAEYVSGANVLLAPGSASRRLPGIEVDGHWILGSDEVLELDRVPGSVAVIGGGAVGCEFASFLSDVGSEVVLVEALASLLPGCDSDVSAVLHRSFVRRGIEVRLNSSVASAATDADGVLVAFNDGTTRRVDRVVVAVGRVPRGRDAVSSTAGVQIDDRGYIVVDGQMRTSVPGVWAAGDAVAGPALAHVGYAEAIAAVMDMLGESPLPVDYSRVPWCIYTHPEVAFVGLSEEAALAAGREVVVSRHRLAGNSRAEILGESEGLVKVIASAGSDGQAGQVLGVHMVGPWVTEQIGQGYLTVNWEATAAEVAALVQPHPSLSEMFGEAMMSLTGRGLHGS